MLRSVFRFCSKSYSLGCQWRVLWRFGYSIGNKFMFKYKPKYRKSFETAKKSILKKITEIFFDQNSNIKLLKVIKFHYTQSINICAPKVSFSIVSVIKCWVMFMFSRSLVHWYKRSVYTYTLHTREKMAFYPCSCASAVNG